MLRRLLPLTTSSNRSFIFVGVGSNSFKSSFNILVSSFSNRMANESEIETKRTKTNNEAKEEKTIGTHSGTFHCDEVLGCFMLKQLPEYENARIFRSRNDEELRKQCDIILDVGGVFDHEQKFYDHHQKTFKETLSSLRPEFGSEFTIRLSSAGLIFTFYGERIIENILKRHANISLSADNLKLSFVQVYRNFIQEIDGIDNGVPICANGESLYKVHTDVCSRIGKLNPQWDENESVDVEQRFEVAMATIGKEFVANVLQVGRSWIKAREYVREALLGAKFLHESGEILLLERFCPWKSHLADLEKEYDLEGVPKLVMFSENPNSWRVAGVPLKPGSYLGRKFLPESWRGLRDVELSKKAGIDNLLFVHHTGFVGGASNKESALAMAIKSIEWKDT